MKFVKGISLFIVYPLFTAVVGFMTGLWVLGVRSYPDRDAPLSHPATTLSGDHKFYEDETSDSSNSGQVEETALTTGETLCVDTQYVLEQWNLDDHSMVESVEHLPSKYIGMDREQFLEAMDVYRRFPPLSEKERGFEGLEVVAFSREKVVVAMNYRDVEKSNSYYLAVKDNEVIVYLEDMQTLYMYTGIRLDELPDPLQMQIIQMLRIEDEEELFDFLENYSS